MRLCDPFLRFGVVFLTTLASIASAAAGEAGVRGTQMATPSAAPSVPPAAPRALRGEGEDRPILVGPLTRTDLKTPPFAEWFERQYAEYEPNAANLEKLRGPLGGLSIEAYLGTWCGDSRRQIPRLVRLLDAAGFDEKRLTLVGLSDRAMEFKHAPGRPEARRLVHRTPTVVILRDGVELGRIVETPFLTLESDLVAILEGRGAIPRYGAEAYVHRLFTEFPTAEAEKALVTAEAVIAKLGDPGSLGHYAEYDLLRNGRASGAKAVLDLHLKLDPKSVSGHLLMSEALEALGRREEALSAAERALALEPANVRAIRAAAKLRAR